MPASNPKARRALAVAVRELRARQRMSQEAVATAAGLGRGFLTELETGRRRVSFEAVVEIAAALDVPFSELVRVYEERLDAQ
jgi:transcriptional regulator with XRE-family HTH domain